MKHVKKSVLCLALAAFFVLSLLSGCAPQPASSGQSAGTNETASTSAPSATEAWAGWAEKYAPILSQYQQVVDMMAAGQTGLTMDDVGSDVNGNVLTDFSTNNSLCYALYDIDNDGTPELLIGIVNPNGTYSQYDIYTYKDGTVVNIFKDTYKDLDNGTFSFGLTVNFTLQGGGIIAVKAGWGTGENGWEFFKMADDNVSFIEGVLREDPLPGVTDFQHYTDGPYGSGSGAPSTITEEQYNAVVSQYVQGNTDNAMNAISLNWIPLTPDAG